MFKENGHYVWEPGGEPAELPCDVCAATGLGRDPESPSRPVVATGVSRGADPTEWYRLECGHVVI